MTIKRDYSAIPVFVAVVENGSFSAAAQSLAMTKSAVSKRIANLESSLGVRLFHRTTRTLRLTEAGERFSDYARHSIGLAEEGFAELSHYQTRPQGTLRVNAPMAFSQRHIVPTIPKFLERYPEINVVLNLNDQLIEMVEGAFDISIRIGALQDSSLIARKLCDCHSVLCASPTYLEQNGVPTTPHDLVDHNCLYYSLFQAGTEWSFSKDNQHYRVTPKGNFVVNNSEAIEEVLKQGGGIAQMPLFLVSSALEKGELVPILSDYALPVHAIYAVYPQRKHLPEKVRVFIEHLQNDISSHAQSW